MKFVTVLSRSVCYHAARKNSGDRGFYPTYQIKTNPPVSRLRLGGLVILHYKPQMDEKSRGTEIAYSGICVRRIRELCRQRGIAINCLAAMRDVKHSTLDNIVRGLPKNPERKPCIRSRRLLI